MGVIYMNDANEVLHKSDNMMSLDRIMKAGEWETKQREQLSYWDFNFREQYAEGMHIGYCEVNVHENIHLTTDKLTPMPGLAFVQHGNLVTQAHDTWGPQQFSPLAYNMLANPYIAEKTTFSKQQQLKILLISFLPERFLQLIENTGPVMDQIGDSITGNGNIPLLPKKSLSVTPRMQTLIREIISNEYAGGLRKLFVQSKAIELLALYCEQLENSVAGEKRAAKLFPADMKKIELAREILLSDLQNPPSLALLARQTGLNEFKLKSGFKAMFNNTVVGYLIDYRLQLAKKLLMENDHSITAIAYETGYATLQHFSNEFKKKFGISPAKIRGK